MRTYTIELRVRFAEEGKYDVMTEAARDAARQILTVAMMLKDTQTDPQIMLEAGDMFERDKDLKLFAEDLQGEPEAGE